MMHTRRKKNALKHVVRKKIIQNKDWSMLHKIFNESPPRNVCNSSQSPEDNIMSVEETLGKNVCNSSQSPEDNIMSVQETLGRNVCNSSQSPEDNIMSVEETLSKGCRNEIQKWVQQQDVDIDEHVIVPNFSASYTQGLHFVEEYTASLATAPPLDPSRPLWQIHVLNYKSAEAEANVVFKIHHCIGNCVSQMSLFLDSTRKHSQPESMPTIPSTNRASKIKLPLWYQGESYRRCGVQYFRCGLQY